MSAIQRISARLALADIVALDRHDRPVLIVGAEEDYPGPLVLASYREIVKAIKRDIPFAILADAENLSVFRKVQNHSLELLTMLPTRKILSFYDPNFVEGRAFKDYIVGMIDSWLRDFMSHWKSPTPPESEMMSAVGLASLLEHGRTKRRVRLACRPVRGDELPIELRDGPEPWNGFHPSGTTSVHPTDLA